jgi:hypothetical protein
VISFRVGPYTQVEESSNDVIIYHPQTLKEEAMKTVARLLVLGFVVVACAGVASAADDVSGMTPAQYAIAEQNLLIGLSSDNLGLKESSAFMLGEIKSSKAVVPLMQMLRESPNESSRIIAALALCRIGDARGAYAVKRATSFDDSEVVQKRCAWFYNEYVHDGSFDFALEVPEVTTYFAQR